MSQEIRVFAQGSAAEGKADEVREILKALVVESNKEPGVVSYTLHEDIKTPGRFYFFESYRDQAAVDAHMASSHFKVAAAKFLPLLAGAPSIAATKIVAGP